MKISVLGTGYVGLVTGSCFADLGNDVTCIDIDREKIDALRAGRVPIYEPGLEELLHRNVEEGRLSFTTSLDDSVKDRDVVFICVGTPQKSTGKADLTHIIEAVESVAKRMNQFLVIVTKSTVPPGTAATNNGRRSGSNSPYQPSRAATVTGSVSAVAIRPGIDAL